MRVIPPRSMRTVCPVRRAEDESVALTSMIVTLVIATVLRGVFWAPIRCTAVSEMAAGQKRSNNRTRERIHTRSTAQVRQVRTSLDTRPLSPATGGVSLVAESPQQVHHVTS